MNSSKKDYEDFLNADGFSPESKLSKDILSFVARDLNPPHSLVFIKLLFIQTIVGIITMLFCPQFDMSLTSSYELFHFFHRNFGRMMCMAICGGIFVGSGAIVGSFFLKTSELKKVSNSPLLYYFSISSIFLLVFLLLGVETYLDISIAWILGAALVGSGLHLVTRKARQMILSSAS